MLHRPFESLVDLIDVATLHPETVANAEQHAEEQKRARRRTRKRGPKKVIQSESSRLAAEVMETARTLAGGDMRRITLDPDGSATVWNHPRTTKPQENR